MMSRADSVEVVALALRRCGSKVARFVEVVDSTCLRIRQVSPAVPSSDAETVVQSGAGPGSFPNYSLDLVFIEGGSHFCSVRKAIRTWWPKLRNGGILAGSGYGSSAEVAAAVDGFVTLQELKHAFRTCGGAWLIYKSLRIDAAYCINLKHRQDRRASALEQFRTAGIRPPVWMFDAVDGKRLRHPGVVSDGQAGCSASHLQVMQAAALRGYKHVLIFEDDVELEENFMLHFNRALARCPASYDLLLIGVCCHPDWGTFLYPVDDLVARAGRVYGNHAYVANLERLLEIDLALRDLRLVFDEWHADVLQPRGDCYVCVPNLAYQIGGQSDISNHQADPSRTWSQYAWR